MKHKNIRWGIIGCGDVTEFKSGPAYQKTEGFELIAVMRRNAEEAAYYAERHGVPKWYSDADLLIADPDVDAVYIATPPDSHAFYALKVAAAGKICCIEKPMARNYEECVAICEAFEAKDIPVFVAYYRRTLGKFQHVRVNLPWMGEIRSIHWQYNRKPSAADLSGAENWRTDTNVAPGGYFEDLASHGLDLFVYLFGNVKEVSGVSTNQQGLYTAKDAVSASWIHESGVVGSANWNFGSYVNKDEVVIQGSKGIISFSMFENYGEVVLDKTDGKSSTRISNPKHIQQYHVELMRDHLFGKKAHVVMGKHSSMGRSAAHTTWIMDQILK